MILEASQAGSRVEIWGGTQMKNLERFVIKM